MWTESIAAALRDNATPFNFVFVGSSGEREREETVEERKKTIYLAIRRTFIRWPFKPARQIVLIAATKRPFVLSLSLALCVSAPFAASVRSRFYAFFKNARYGGRKCRRVLLFLHARARARDSFLGCYCFFTPHTPECAPFVSARRRGYKKSRAFSCSPAAYFHDSRIPRARI